MLTTPSNNFSFCAILINLYHIGKFTHAVFNINYNYVTLAFCGGDVRTAQISTYLLLMFNLHEGTLKSMEPYMHSVCIMGMYRL